MEFSDCLNCRIKKGGPFSNLPAKAQRLTGGMIWFAGIKGDVSWVYCRDALYDIHPRLCKELRLH